MWKRRKEEGKVEAMTKDVCSGIAQRSASLACLSEVGRCFLNGESRGDRRGGEEKRKEGTD